LVRGSSGVGKAAFLQYLLERTRNEVNDVLVVHSSSYDANKKEILHLSTGWFGRKTATRITEFEAGGVEEKCTWTIVDGCDWEPIANFTVSAASPSTPWKGFRKASNLIELCMPQWSLSQLEKCTALTHIAPDGDDSNLLVFRINYELIGGIARWALRTTKNVNDQVHSAVRDINFECIQQAMATRHLSKQDERELLVENTKRQNRRMDLLSRL